GAFQIVLDHARDPVDSADSQILVQHLGPELPAGRELQLRAELRQVWALLCGRLSLGGHFDAQYPNPRVASHITHDSLRQPIVMQRPSAASPRATLERGPSSALSYRSVLSYSIEVGGTTLGGVDPCLRRIASN